MKKLYLLMLALLVGTLSSVAQDTWTVAGNAVNGTAWDAGNSANDMTTTDGVNFTLTVEELTLEKATEYKYKVVKNHAWGEAYPAQDKVFTVDATGKYTVVYSFNAETKAVSETATKTGEADEVSHVYSIAGEPPTLFGGTGAWDETNTATEMTLQEGLYTWTKENVQLAAGSVSFKVVQDHSWNVAYPGSNYQLAIPEEAKYNVTITFNSDTKAVNATATKTADVQKTVFTASFQFGEGVTAWDKVFAYTYNEQTLGDWPGTELTATDGVYAVSFESAAAPGFIIFNNGVSGEGAVQTADLAFENGKAYTYAPEPEPQPEAIEKMYIVGELTGGWPVDAAGDTPADWSMAKEMTQDAENADIWTLTIEGFEAEAKIYKYKAAANQKWTVYTLPAEGDNEFEFGTEGYPAGKYNLTFTVNTKEHSLTLTAQKVEEVKPIIPDGTYYVMNSKTGAVVNAEGAIDVKGAPITFAFDATAKTYTITGAEFFAGKQWTVANMYDDMPGFFAITTVVESATKYLTVDADSKLTLADAADDNAVWIVLEKAYWEDIMNSTYTIAGTKNLTGTENDWDVVEANQMKYNEETQLFEITYKGITVTNDVKPEFKVVKTPMEGEKIWFPTGDNSNWVITPEVVGGEGEYVITITFDPSDAKEIKVSGLKIEDITISPESGADIFETLIAAEMNKLPRNITINLAEGGNYTISGPLTAYANFEIQGNGATIDASGLNNNFIQMAVTDDPKVTIAVEYVSIHNATIKGLKKPLFHSTQKGYLINWLTIDNSIVEVAADVTSIDFTKGSAARNFNIEKSTIYAPAATTKSFYSSQSGQKLTELDTEGTQTFIIKNSTLYNLAKSKNFFTHRQNSQNWLAYNAENSIFVNCGKSGQTIKGLNGGGASANPTWTITGNAFNFEADGVMTDTSAGEATGDDAEPVQNSVAGVITFTDAAAGDFSGEFQLAKGAAKPEALGDARWTITFKEAPLVITAMYIVGDFTGGFPTEEAESWSVAAQMTQSTENAAVWTLTLENQSIEGKAYEYKAAANGNWNDYVLPYGPQNAEFVFGTEGYPAGVYNLTFTVNTEEHTLTLVPTPVSDGISSVRMTEAVKNGEVYNLNGQRVAQPTKGLYIINGRKVVVK